MFSFTPQHVYVHQEKLKIPLSINAHLNYCMDDLARDNSISQINSRVSVIAKH